MSHSILTQTAVSVDAHREKSDKHHQDKAVAAALYGKDFMCRVRVTVGVLHVEAKAECVVVVFCCCYRRAAEGQPALLQHDRVVVRRDRDLARAQRVVQVHQVLQSAAADHHQGSA